jgi:hypothetical protein
MMTVTPIQARCSRCLGDFQLFEVVEARTGLCPRCGWRLTEDWTAALLDDAARADIAQRHLVGALRGLRNLPGSLVLLPHSVLRNVVAEVGWTRDTTEHFELLADERRRLDELHRTWPTDPEPGGAPQPSRRARLVRWLGLKAPLRSSSGMNRSEPARS